MPELMKGHVWLERKDAVDRKGNPIVKYPVYAEVKHDEIRCHVLVGKDGVQFLSYSGKPLANMHGFSARFIELAERTGYKEFDCGFEVNGNFNDSYRWVRSTRTLPEDLHGATFQFYLFDVPECTLPWRDRVAIREDICKYGLVDAPDFVLCRTPDGVDQYFSNVVQAGYEGLMIKQLDHTYQKGKRTDGWLKYKPEETADGEITMLVQATSTVDDETRGVRIGDGLSRVGSVLVRCEDGSTCCPHGISHALGTEMFNNPARFIGQWCEFKYMQRDRQGGYRHPVFKRLREAKV